MDEKRFDRRRNLLGTVDEHFKAVEKADSISAMDSFYQAAYGLISSKQAREAFDLTKESDKLRDEYGRNTAGQRFLLARRLVEAGVRMVSVNYGGWDHHSNIKDAFTGQAPNLDRACARLITDLSDRGMLKRTLVMVSSEFGRTPKINGTNGRDHWPRVFSVAMAGGSMKEGYIHGASDALGGEPDRDAVGPEDLADPCIASSASTARSASWPTAVVQSTSSTAVASSRKPSRNSRSPTDSENPDSNVRVFCVRMA